MRHCPFNNCGLEIPDTMFACRKHWFSLTPLQRDAVQRAYQSYLDDTIGMEELRAYQQKILDNVAGGPHHA